MTVHAAKVILLDIFFVNLDNVKIFVMDLCAWLTHFVELPIVIAQKAEPDDQDRRHVEVDYLVHEFH